MCQGHAVHVAVAGFVGLLVMQAKQDRGKAQDGLVRDPTTGCSGLSGEHIDGLGI